MHELATPSTYQGHGIGTPLWLWITTEPVSVTSPKSNSASTIVAHAPWNSTSSLVTRLAAVACRGHSTDASATSAAIGITLWAVIGQPSVFSPTPIVATQRRCGTGMESLQSIRHVTDEVRAESTALAPAVTPPQTANTANNTTP